MESKEDINSGVKGGDGGFGNYCVAPRVENPSHSSAPAMTGAAAPPGSVVAPPPNPVVKKKMGRPRKYGPDGLPLSPMPISASFSLSGDYPAWKHPRARPIPTVKKAHKLDFESLGDRLAFFVGADFTPHVITVNAGEDVAMKIHSFSQQESRAVCILSAIGSISNVTLRQPHSSGGTLTYEGHFEILSLCGSLMPNDNGIVKSRSGGMSVSLAGPDGRVMGGGLAGLLIAASPVQLVLGSFLPNNNQEHPQPKKSRTEPTPTPSTMPATVSHHVADGPHNSQKPSFTTTPASFPPNNNSASLHNTHDTKDDLDADTNLSSSSLDGDSDDDDDDNDDSPSRYEITG